MLVRLLTVEEFMTKYFSFKKRFKVFFNIVNKSFKLPHSADGLSIDYPICQPKADL